MTIHPKKTLVFVLCLITTLPKTLAEQQIENATPDLTLADQASKMLSIPGGLVSEEVANRSDTTSFDVAAKKEEVRAAAAALQQAYIGYFPKLVITGRYDHLSPIEQPNLGSSVGAPTIDASNGPVLIPPGTPLYASQFSFPVFLNQYNFQGNLLLPLTDYILRITKSYAAASHSKKSAELNMRATRAKVRTEAKILYYNWARAKLSELVTEQAVELSKGQLKDTQRGFEVGTLSKADVLQTDAQLAQAEQLLVRTQNLTEVLETQLRTVMHDPSMTPYEIGEALDKDRELMTSGLDIKKLAKEATEKRLEIRAMDESIKSLEEQKVVARAPLFPRIEGLANLTVANPNQRFIPNKDRFDSTWSVGALATWVPNEAFTAIEAGKSLEAKRAQLMADRQKLIDGLRTEVAEAIQELRNTKSAQVTTVRARTSALESYRVRRELFRVGRATTIEVTAAETEMTRAGLNLISAKIDAHIAQIKFDHALGRDLSSVK